MLVGVLYLEGAMTLKVECLLRNCGVGFPQDIHHNKNLIKGGFIDLKAQGL